MKRRLAILLLCTLSFLVGILYCINFNYQYKAYINSKNIVKRYDKALLELSGFGDQLPKKSEIECMALHRDEIERFGNRCYYSAFFPWYRTNHDLVLSKCDEYRPQD